MQSLFYFSDDHNSSVAMRAGRERKRESTVGSRMSQQFASGRERTRKDRATTQRAQPVGSQSLSVIGKIGIYVTALAMSNMSICHDLLYWYTELCKNNPAWFRECLAEILCHSHCPEFKFMFLFFRLQMLHFSALCGQIWQKF